MGSYAPSEMVTVFCDWPGCENHSQAFFHTPWCHQSLTFIYTREAVEEPGWIENWDYPKALCPNHADKTQEDAFQEEERVFGKSVHRARKLRREERARRNEERWAELRARAKARREEEE